MRNGHAQTIVRGGTNQGIGRRHYTGRGGIRAQIDGSANVGMGAVQVPRRQCHDHRAGNHPVVSKIFKARSTKITRSAADYASGGRKHSCGVPRRYAAPGVRPFSGGRAIQRSAPPVTRINKVVVPILVKSVLTDRVKITGTHQAVGGGNSACWARAASAAVNPGDSAFAAAPRRRADGVVAICKRADS